MIKTANYSHPLHHCPTRQIKITTYIHFTNHELQFAINSMVKPTNNVYSYPLNWYKPSHQSAPIITQQQHKDTVTTVTAATTTPSTSANLSHCIYSLPILKWKHLV